MQPPSLGGIPSSNPQPPGPVSALTVQNCALKRLFQQVPLGHFGN